MSLFETFFMNMMSALGINGNLAVLMLLLCLGASLTVIAVARMQVRQKMHADHFDVLDKTQTESLRQSSKSLEQSSYTKGSVDTLFLLLGDEFKKLVKGSALMDDQVSGDQEDS